MSDTLIEDVEFTQNQEDYHSLNAAVNLYDTEGRLQLHRDALAAKQYFLQHVNPNTQYFHSLSERLEYLFEEGYYDKAVFDQYSFEFIQKLNDHLYGFKYRFRSFMGAMKFYSSYAMKTRDGKRYLERFEDRVLANALFLGDGNEADAWEIGRAVITSFQPATPTFANAGKKARGGFTSCFLLRTEDNLESIARTVTNTMQLAKRGGGVGILATNIREAGAPIKGIQGAASGVVPYAKVLDDSLAWINQLGTRTGAGVVYINAHHPDVMTLLDSKRENADDLVRLKILSIGLMVPDITYELAKTGAPMYLFSPHDVTKVYGVPYSDISVTEKYHEMVEDDRIKKYKLDAREFFQKVAEVQAESGYPYIIHEDTVNAANPVHGRINMSNLCVEITQVNTPTRFKEDGTFEEVGYDISCNLGSLLVSGAVRSGNLERVVDASLRALTTVTLRAEFGAVPSVEAANNAYHSVGLGHMGLHGFFMEEGIAYDSEEALDFVDAYFSAINFYSLKASNKIARERDQVFHEFDKSKYATGEYFDQYVSEDFTPKTDKVRDMVEYYGLHIPSREEWAELSTEIQETGLFHSYRSANAPNGSISYVRDVTSSIHPITSLIESRSEGRMGTVYYPAQGLTTENKDDYQDAYQIGWKPLIDLYARAQRHIDQSQSLTLFFDKNATNRDVLKAQQYAFRSGIKSLYYARFQRDTISGADTDAALCVSCSI